MAFANLPPTHIPVLDDNGQFSDPWRRWLQDRGVTGADIAALEAEIAAVATTATTAETTAAQALAVADEALAASGTQAGPLPWLATLQDWGTVQQVASANGALTVVDGARYPSLTINSAPKLTTARTFSYTGNVSGGPTSFDGSGNVSTALTIAASGVTAATYGNATNVPQITVNAEGRVTAASNVAITGGGGNGTVTSVGAGTGLTASPSPITGAGNLSLTTPVIESLGGTGHTGNYTAGQLLIGNASSGGLDVSTLTAGSNVTITNGNGSISIAATGGGVVTPTIRNTSAMNNAAGATSSGVITLPTGSLAGDMGVLFYSGDNTPTLPTGWNQLDLQLGTNIAGLVCAKRLTSGDISTGNVSVTFSGSSGYTMCMITFVGGITSVGLLTSFRSSTGASPVSTGAAPVSSVGMIILFGGTRANNTVTVSRGTLQQQIHTATSVASGGALYTDVSPFVYGTGATFTNLNGTGYYYAVVGAAG